MLATVFPVLMVLGISPMTGSSVLALLCLDYGPNDASTLFMSTVAKMNAVDLFLQYQFKVALCIILTAAVLIPFYYRYMDRKDKEAGVFNAFDSKELENPDVPAYYVLLPLIPLIIVFVNYFVSPKKIDVITANILGFAVTFVIEFIRRSDRSEIPADMVVILKAMGNIFVSVVSIIISASVFAEGIKVLGGIAIFVNMISGMQSAVLVVMILLTGITYVFAAIMGSGAAPFFAFGPLTPEIAAKLGVSTLTLLLPMEVATSLGRGSSPVCGALIAIAGVAGVTPMALAKRTAPLLFIMLLVNIVASYIFI
jgi:DcuC family C4-dicarboxylate transporter